MPKSSTRKNEGEVIHHDPETEDSSWFYYTCAHGANNVPCPECHPGAETMPDDWMKTYVPPTPPGITDDVNAG